MNERIKELAEQCGFRPQPSIYDRNQSFDIEKFANLIVLECLSQVDKIRDGLETDSEDEQALGADWAGLAIARHFGVK
tara:strand:- start:366 stop:599 length:234 start_codon:yes stop_codon:yes gene_type:complete